MHTQHKNMHTLCAHTGQTHMYTHRKHIYKHKYTHAHSLTQYTQRDKPTIQIYICKALNTVTWTYMYTQYTHSYTYTHVYMLHTCTYRTVHIYNTHACTLSIHMCIQRMHTAQTHMCIHAHTYTSTYTHVNTHSHTVQT